MNLSLPDNNRKFVVYDFDENDLGEVPEWSKDELNGAVIIVHGISERSFDNGEFGKPAYSLLWNLLGDADAMNPNGWHYGLLFSEDSLPITLTRRSMEKGKVPFVAQLVKVDKKGTKGQTYWNLLRWKQQYGADGQPVNPNEALLGKAG